MPQQIPNKFGFAFGLHYLCISCNFPLLNRLNITVLNGTFPTFKINDFTQKPKKGKMVQN